MAQFIDILYPKDYGFSDMQILSSCQDELRSFIEASGLQAKLLSGYERRLEILNKYRTKAPSVNRQWFEHLKGEGPYYSMRFKSLENLRILYTFKENRVYLLCAFAEKNKEDYYHYIAVAKKRAKLI